MFGQENQHFNFFTNVESGISDSDLTL
ncbi:protein of unknown function [Candidatus Promineifilum breve]|uniref:Uncharacterized protein n=1 Tax=Candidatus Promineifilum breve TaxID=1806508 RepID=A0A160T7Y1_9CHLR|nr:protein of unknown function [Candidatus Promineifilum breve]